MIKDEEAIEAAKTLRAYCDQSRGCYECPAYKNHDCTVGHPYAIELEEDHQEEVEILPICEAKDEAICEEMTADGHCSYTGHCPNKGGS